MAAVLKPSPAPALTAGPTVAAIQEGEEELPPPDLVSGNKQNQHMQKVFDEVTERLRGETAQSTRLLQSWMHTE
jgi:flagellar M-ring protein FliF